MERGKSMSKILVTGGAGYLGSVLTMHLLAKNHQVTILDSFMYYQTGIAPLCTYPNLTLIRGDVRDQRVLLPLVKEADIIMPLAALVGVTAADKNSDATMETNTHQIRTIVNALGRMQLLIYPNTNSGYGIGGKGECTEDQPLAPISEYGKSKVAAEFMIRESNNLSFIIFRFATLFGVSLRMRLDLMVNDFTYKAVQGKSLVLFEPWFRRNFLHVHDAAQAFLFAIEHADQMNQGIFNAGLSSANITKMELCRRISNHVLGFIWFESNAGHDPDKRDYVVSNKKLEALGWMPKHSLDDGIAELVKVFSAVPYSVPASYTNT